MLGFQKYMIHVVAEGGKVSRLGDIYILIQLPKPTFIWIIDILNASYTDRHTHSFREKEAV